MEPRINTLLGNTTTLLATLLATAAIVALIAACGGGEPEEITFDLEIKERQINIDVMEAIQDDTVTLNISTDEPGEFHLHGYDLQKEITTGEVTTLTFITFATGKFNIVFHPASKQAEDHDHDNDKEKEEILIGSLEVQPR